MKIENSPPNISLYSVKNIVENITYDETAIKEIDFYNKEFQRHYLATMYPCVQAHIAIEDK